MTYQFLFVIIVSSKTKDKNKMIMKILAVIGIIAVMSFLRVAEYKARDFDYKNIPVGITGWINFGFLVYLIWVWLGTFE